jgi:hypothetical protein
VSTTGTVTATACSATTTWAATTTASTPASTKFTPLPRKGRVFSLNWGFFVLFPRDGAPLFGVT